MIEAWLSWSDTIRSGSDATTGMTPVLAVKPDWKVSTASTCLNVASAASSSSWRVIVPEIVRTAPHAIHQAEEGWEKTLTGIPKEIYDFWQRQLKSRGYHIRYEVIDYPGGMPGDIGIILSWQ